MIQLARVLAVLVALSLATATVTALVVLVHGPRSGPSSWRMVLQIVALSVAWLLTNSPYEGRVL